MREQHPLLLFRSDLHRTPPFSSEEETEEEDFMQAYLSPDLFSTQPPKNSTSNFGKRSVRSDTDWTEGSEMDDSDFSPKLTGEP